MPQSRKEAVCSRGSSSGERVHADRDVRGPVAVDSAGAAAAAAGAAPGAAAAGPAVGRSHAHVHPAARRRHRQEGGCAHHIESGQ